MNNDDVLSTGSYKKSVVSGGSKLGKSDFNL